MPHREGCKCLYSFLSFFFCFLPLSGEEVENTGLDFHSLKCLGRIELKEADIFIVFQTNPDNLGIDGFVLFFKRDSFAPLSITVKQACISLVCLGYHKKK